MRDDVAAGRRRLRHQSGQSVREATTAAGIDNAASPDWQTPLNGIISTLGRGLITMQKQLEGTQKYINEQCSQLPISMGDSCNYCEQYTRASSGV
ncbi:lysis system i-spanin subunit Rz [Staphylococcus aureus]